MTRSAALCVVAIAMLQSGATRLYRDPAGRFTFNYPSSFGDSARGTNDGFEDRVAAISFSTFPAVFKGEAVLRNVNPRVVECRVEDGVVVFDKERSAAAGGPVQHVYGAVRFLPAPFSTFHVIAAGNPPDRAMLTALADLVRSFSSN